MILMKRRTITIKAAYYPIPVENLNKHKLSLSNPNVKIINDDDSIRIAYWIRVSYGFSKFYKENLSLYALGGGYKSPLSNKQLPGYILSLKERSDY